MARKRPEAAPQDATPAETTPDPSSAVETPQATKDAGLSEAQAALELLNPQLAALGMACKLALVNPSELEEIDRNAHYMPYDTFRALEANIGKDGFLASVPYCWKNPETGRFVVLSGNHRVKAATAAGIKWIVVMYDDRPLTLSERRSIQLSHNAIVGKDDPSILKELWSQIDSLELKLYSGLDDKALGELAASALKAFSEAPVKFKAVTFLFLPEEAEELQAIFNKAAEELKCEEAYIAPLREWEVLIEALDKTKAAWNTRNSAVAFFIMLRIMQLHWSDLTEGWLGKDENGDPKHKHPNPVPMETIFGSNRCPAKVMVQVKRAWDRAIGAGKVTHHEPWKLLELMANAYLQSKG